MVTESYDIFVRRLVKHPYEISSTLTLQQVDAIHMIMGISGESGELLDAVKKWVIYNKPVDRENLIEELGDLEFYLEGFRQALGIDRDQVIVANMEKLKKRYVGMTYSDQAAQNRADKNSA